MCEIKGVFNNVSQWPHDLINTAPIKATIWAGNYALSKISAIVQAIISLNNSFDDTVIKGITRWKAQIYKASVNTLSYVIVRTLIPSLTHSKKKIDDYYNTAQGDIALINQSNGPIRAETVTLATKEGISLNGIFITHKNVKPKNQRVIIYSPGNYEVWQQNIPLFKAMSELFQANILSYNYRGVGETSSWPEEESDLIQDKESEVKSLISIGILPKHILLFGRSLLGGAISLITAKTLEESGITVHAAADRSSKSIHAHLRALFPRTGNLVASCIKSYNWKLHAEKALSDFSGKVILVHDDKDSRLPYQASLKATAPTDHKNITMIKMQELAIVNNSFHLRPYTMQEVEALATHIRALW